MAGAKGLGAGRDFGKAFHLPREVHGKVGGLAGERNSFLSVTLQAWGEEAGVGRLGD